MANYGISAYQAAYYGPSNTNSLLAQNFTASPVPPVGSSTLQAFNTIYLSWGTPAGSGWYHMRLVRNEYGFPAHQDDGIVLFDINSGPAGTHPDQPIVSWVDSGLKAPRFYYYSLFVSTLVSTSTQWVRVGDAVGQSVSDHKYGDYLLQRLPSSFSSPQGSVEEEPYPGSALSRFLNIFGADLSRVRDYLDHLNYVEDPDRVNGLLLPAMLAQYGYNYEPAVGMQRNRVLAENAVYINTMKGTSSGLTTLASAVTGYPTKQLRLVNLMLDENNASAEQSIGNWANDTNGVVGRVTTPTFSNGTNQSAGAFSITATAAADAFINVANSDPVHQGIPVTPGLTYVLSSYWRAATTGRTVGLYIAWYTQAGGFISNTTIGTTADVTGSWTRDTQVAVAPSTAAYASIHAKVTAPGAGEVHYLDAIQFETPANLLYAYNPSFEASSISPWSLANGTTTTLTVDTTQSHSGSQSAKMVNTTSGQDAYIAINVPCAHSTSYTITTFVYAPQFTAGAISNRGLAVYGMTSGGAATGVAGVVNLTASNTGWVALTTTVTTGTTDAYLQIRLYAPQGTVYWDDVSMFSGTASATTYTSARQTRLMLTAARVNELLNGGFNADVSNWNAGGATIAWDGTTTYNGGAGSCKATVTAGTTSGFWTEAVVDGGRPVMVAAQIRPQTDGDEYYLRVDWLDAYHATISTTYGQVIKPAAGTWQRAVLVEPSPPTNAVYADLTIYSKFGLSNFWVDDAILEQGLPTGNSQYGSGTYGSGPYDQVIPPYFDIYLNSGDAKWEGTANASRLHLYPNFGPRNSRLTDLISKAVPLGFDYSLNYAQPRGTQ